MMIVVDSVADLREAVSGLRKNHREIGFVPTMGALHDGHAALVRRAVEQCGAAVASIFVNPTQFGPNEDFARYPRSLDADLEKLRQAGAGVVYTPTPETMYPKGFATTVRVGTLGEGLDGAIRSGHFDGVCTVVSKLFLQVMPDTAFFGEKDYQQLKIIQRMARDLDFPINIVGVPTIREPDGLAMSSRNRYLSAAERAIAPTLYRILIETAKKLRAGDDVPKTLDEAAHRLKQEGFGSVDYVELRHAGTLAPLTAYAPPARLLAAARLGDTRLIDNVAVE